MTCKVGLILQIDDDMLAGQRDVTEVQCSRTGG